ncbi:Fur family transcriptional regulator [Siphonobacter sp. SORGH_AS_1065]|uniref:Fur family transcriptional regulator n=1 Tax=Siphonobacter sp. SORGH_AS_1065 TaxID=3041795 RepID=UPI00277FC5B4|nr:transcriptional repressor [Siphonobacter sp. SORGH_AS_1065]MDQ1086474.1 Fur family ferric uptake transcriptional regulator [Siphonobacter sp. SORGH_AS_1065]
MNKLVPATLKQHNLRHTEAREEVLDLFYNKSFALSHGGLESELQERFDRVTIYRTLKTFLDKGIIHKVLDDEGTVKYAMCKDACQSEDHTHHHDHVHFKCLSCGQTTCLDHVKIPSLALPEGYKRQEINLLVQGICPDCKS